MTLSVWFAMTPRAIDITIVARSSGQVECLYNHLLEPSREHRNALYRDHVGIILPDSLLSFGKTKEP